MKELMRSLLLVFLSVTYGASQQPAAPAEPAKQEDKQEPKQDSKAGSRQGEPGVQSVSPLIPLPAAGESKPATAPNANPPADPAALAAPSPSASVKAVASAPVSEKTYVIGAEDLVGIQVWGVAQLSAQYLVRPDGRISMPLIGDVMVMGLTPEQVQKTVAERLKEKYINSPDVTVLILQVNSKKYYIHGEVNSPGSYTLVVPTTVLEGLANAHGFKEFANIKKIRILRGKEQLRFNYKDVSKGKHPEQNVYLQAGDVIVVP